MNNNKGLAACVSLEGPPEAEACGILKINLTASSRRIIKPWRRAPTRECAGVVRANAYGCGIGPIAGALAKSGCKTFFVSDIPEARRVRSVAPHSTIYVLSGLYSGGEVAIRPVLEAQAVEAI